MAYPRTHVGKLFASFRHKLPVITARMQGQHEHAKGIVITHLTVEGDPLERGMIGTAAPNDELSDAADGVWRCVRRLRRKSLIDVVMSVQDHIYVVIVQALPDRLGVGGITAAGAKQWNVPVCQGTKIRVSSQIRLQPLPLR